MQVPFNTIVVIGIVVDIIVIIIVDVTIVMTTFAANRLWVK